MALNRFKRLACGTALITCLSVFALEGPALAQGDPSDIIVTARKREESILQVPVVVTAVSGETLQNFQVTQVSDLPGWCRGWCWAAIFCRSGHR